MKFIVEDDNILVMVMGYLRERGLYESLSSLQLETGKGEGNLSEELSYLQRLTLQGRWDDVFTYLQPLKRLIATYDDVVFYIKRQQFLEALTWQGTGGYRHALLPWRPIKTSNDEEQLDIASVVALLKSIEKMCPPKEFNSLCMCLTLEKLSDNPDFQNWSVSQGRLECFQKLRNLLCNIVPGNNDALPSLQDLDGKDDNHCGLYSTIAMALAFQCNIDVDELGATDNRNDGINISTKWDHRIIRPNDNVAVTPTNIPKINVIGYDTKRRDMMEVNEKPPYNSHQYSIPVVTSSNQNNEPHQQQQLTKKKSEAWSVDIRTSKEELKESRSPQRPKSAPYGDQVGNKSLVIIKKQPVSWTVDVGDEESNGGKLSQINRIIDKGQNSKIPAKSKSDKGTKDFEEKSRVREQSLKEFEEEEKRIQTKQQYSPAKSTNSIRTGGVKKDNDADTVMSTLSAPTPTSKTNLLSSVLNVFSGSKERPNSAPNTKKGEGGGPRSFASAYTVIDDESIPGSQYSHFTSDSMQHKRKMGEGAAILLPNNVWDGVGSDQGVCIPQTLYQCSQPIRCAHFLSAGHISDYDERSHVIVALGTNAKNIHTLSYSTSYENENIPVVPKKEIDFLDVHRGSVYTMDYSSQHKIIATGSNDKAVKLCNMSSGTIGPPLKGHNGTIRIVKFNPGTSLLPLLASGGAGDNSARIWDISKYSCISALEPHEDAVHGLTWIDSDLLLSGCDKGKIIAHDIRSRCAAWSIDLPKLVGQALGICTMTATTQGSDSVLLGCTNGLVIGISPRDRRVLAAEKLHGDDVRGLCIAPWQDSNVSGLSSSFYFLTTSFDGTACVWRSHELIGINQSKRPFQRLSVLQGHTDKVLGAAIGPDNYEMITTGADGKALLWKPKVSATFL